MSVRLLEGNGLKGGLSKVTVRRCRRQWMQSFEGTKCVRLTELDKVILGEESCILHEGQKRLSNRAQGLLYIE